MAGLVDTLLLIEGEAGIHFGRHASRNAFKNFRTKIDRQFVAGFGNLLFLGFTPLLSPADRIVNQMRVVRQASGFQQQGRVGGGILGLVMTNRLNIAAVGHDSGELFDAV